MHKAWACAVTVFMFSISCLAFSSRADGINSLISVAKSMDEAKKELAKETSNFDRIKNAHMAGTFAKGLPRESVWNMYGEPVVMNEDFATKRERWVYKPASSSFFEGEKVELFFDSGGLLDEVRHQ